MHTPRLYAHHHHGLTLATVQDSDEPGSKAHELYVRSHGAFAPGEQRRRPYNWVSTGVDPKEFRFGAVARSDVMNGVQKALNSEADNHTIHCPALVNKAVEDHKLVNSDVLGKSRKLGAGDRGLAQDFTFGKPTLGKV
jgi:EF-hand domain-containing family member B